MIDFTHIPPNTNSSSKGNQLKWQKGEYWYKVDCSGYEALAEFIVSQLLKKSTAKVISYDLVPLKYANKELVGCKSKDFLQPEQELITLQRLYQTHQGESLVEKLVPMEVSERIKYVVDFVKKSTNLFNFGQYLSTLLEVDALFVNEDRHMNNIAVLFNSKKKTYDYCPLFDNGAALFSDTITSFPMDYDVWKCFKEIKAKPFSIDFEEQVTAVEELYGVQFAFWFDVHDVEKLLEKASVYYSKDVIERVDIIIREQLRRYTYLKKQKPLEEIVETASQKQHSQKKTIVEGRIDTKEQGLF